MKKIILIVISISLSIMLIPYVTSNAVISSDNYEKVSMRSALIPQYIQTPDKQTGAKDENNDKNNTEKNQTNTKYKDKKIKIYKNNTEKIEEISMYDYICGVVAAEMSADSPAEALKAQAVAAYTYTIYKMEAAKGNSSLFPEHKGADACTDPGHCKAFYTKSEAKNKWGENWYNKYWKCIEDAVNAVDNKAILYENKPINSVFHAISSGKTEDAVAVWGSEVPYLKSVESTQDKSAPLYKSIETVTLNTFKEKMAGFNKDMAFSEDPNTWIGEIKRSQESGVVEKIIICGTEIRGSDIRNIFGLRSSNFSIKYSNSSFIFEVFGYGHGVGMSQYGACALARDGKNYQEILKYYYSSVEIADYYI